MTYDKVEDATKALNQAFMDLFRPTMGSSSRQFGSIVKVLDVWALVEPGITALDPGTVIETTTGLAGAMPLTRESLLKTMGNLQQAIDTFYGPEERALYIAAAGPANTV